MEQVISKLPKNTDNPLPKLVDLNKDDLIIQDTQDFLQYPVELKKKGDNTISIIGNSTSNTNKEQKIIEENKFVMKRQIQSNFSNDQYSVLEKARMNFQNKEKNLDQKMIDQKMLSDLVEEGLIPENSKENDLQKNNDNSEWIEISSFDLIRKKREQKFHHRRRKLKAQWVEVKKTKKTKKKKKTTNK
ncbi:hypothetical protein M0812_04975 [Anaeramoeba flamelloides]|uniref:Uncharacterized protein n=1 Tax=Anaeramoeba flamelloides TaxID=1746091 RepID=A0AAV8AEL1_9EUKA|nr:hypothetical protein M0812_04975 [Anaeramoeba flamelloides]